MSEAHTVEARVVAFQAIDQRAVRAVVNERAGLVATRGEAASESLAHRLGQNLVVLLCHGRSFLVGFLACPRTVAGFAGQCQGRVCNFLLPSSSPWHS